MSDTKLQDYFATFETVNGRRVLADLVRFVGGAVGDPSVRCGRQDVVLYIQKQLLPQPEPPTVVSGTATTQGVTRG